MLRITKQAEGEQTILRVEGKLVPPWVEELESCWRQNTGAGALVLDVRAITFVGAEGKELLGRIHRSGAKLLTSGIAMREMLEQLEIHSNGKGK